MKVSFSTRKEHLKNSRLRLYPDTDELRRLFAGKSYAVVAYGKSEVKKKRWFVPIIPRHMDSLLWRQIFWHDPVCVVIKGREYKSLCSMCSNIMLCLKQPQFNFICKFNAKTTSTVDMGTGDEHH
jgi:hypothetical protein